MKNNLNLNYPKRKHKNWNFKLQWNKTIKSIMFNLFPDSRFRVWLYVSKFQNEKIHFCFILFNDILGLDTAHLGKKLWGRLNLTKFLRRDLLIYSKNEGELSSPIK